MATGKRYYWMKLKESFMTSDTIDFFMSQPNGAQYVVLYQMLCLKTINTGGKLERRIGEVLIPFDVAKITRDMKWFSEDTVRVAMQLYKQFGLIYKDENGVLVMTDHNNLVGSETDYAIQKKIQRAGNDKPKKLSPGSVDNNADKSKDNVHTDIEIRDKENREKRLEKEIEVVDKSDGGDISPEFQIDPEEETRIREEQNEILNAAEYAGFAKSSATYDALINLYATYGKEKVLEGIQICVKRGKISPGYLEGCLKRNEKKGAGYESPFRKMLNEMEATQNDGERNP